MVKEINLETVIASAVVSAITVQIILSINISILKKRFTEFQTDTIEACTNQVARYIHKNT